MAGRGEAGDLAAGRLNVDPLQQALYAEIRRQGWSWVDLAARVGVSPPTLHGYFKPDSSMTLRTADKLARAINRIVVYRLEAPE